MGTTLDHGIYLPDEGERNCYDGLAGNWVALDNHLGSIDIHVTINDKQAWNGHVADTTIHVTSADKQTWNSHVADTTIHVTAEDKAKWDAVTSKADASAVVHNTENETIAGIKTFTDNTFVKSLNFTNEVPSPSSSNSSILPIITTITYGDSSPRVQARLNLRVTADGTKSLYPHENNQYALGLTNRKWSEVHGVTYYYGSSDTEFSDKFVTTDTAQTISGNKTFSSINGVEPSSLGMPDLNNGVDISGYITHLDKVVNNYTPPANGWLSIRVKKTSLVHASLMIYQTGGLLSSCETDEFNISGTNLPVIANQNVEIYIYADVLVSAKFYPCQGNV